MELSDFEKRVRQAAETAVLKFVGNPDGWLVPDYANRFKIPADFLPSIWAMVDIEKVKAKMASRLEDELAERVMNAMAAEIATDVKQILSVKERREALRAVMRENLDRILKAG